MIGVVETNNSSVKKTFLADMQLYINRNTKNDRF